MSEAPRLNSQDMPSIWGSCWIPLLGLLVAFLLYVFVFSPVSVTLDGYSHLYQAHVLKEMLAGRPEIHAYFRYNSFFIPNWLSTLCLIALSSLVPSELALKLLVVLISGALLYSLYTCVNVNRYETRQRAQVLIVLLPLATNGYLTLGFYGFTISSAISIFVLGRILRRGTQASLRSQVLLAFLLLLAYFFHPLPVIITFLYPCSHLISSVISRPFQEWREAIAEAIRRPCAIWPWIPPAGLLSWFSLRLASRGPSIHYSLTKNVVHRAIELMRADTILSFSPSAASGTLFIAFLAVCAVWACLSAGELSPQDQLSSTTLTVLFFSILILFFLAPDTVGEGRGIGARLLFYAFIFITLLALTRGIPDTRLLTLCSLLAAGSVFLFAAEYMVVSRRLAPAVAELQLAMERLPKHSRILMLGYRRTPSCPGWPLRERSLPERHWAMKCATVSDVIVLNDFEAYTDHFPLRYVNSRYASVIRELDLKSAEQRAAWTAVLKRNDPNVDFIVSWGTPSGVHDCLNPVGAPFEDLLRIHYDRVLSKKESSSITVWKKRT